MHFSSEDELKSRVSIGHVSIIANLLVDWPVCFQLFSLLFFRFLPSAWDWKLDGTVISL